MRQRQRNSDPIPAEPNRPESQRPHGPEFDRGEALLAAADEAINRALSGDSLSFIARNRQMGGQ